MPIRRLIAPILLLLLVYVAGTLGYYALGLHGAAHGIIPAAWSLMDCAFMTAISLTTVGYGDILGIYDNNYILAQVYTILLLFGGMGVVLFVVSEATSFFVEGHLGRIVERRRMLKNANKLENHIILCGMGDTGFSAMTELLTVGEAFVAIDEDHQTCERIMARHPGVIILEGSAWEEEVLNQAGIAQARGLMACLSDDRDNVLLTITAKVIRVSPRPASDRRPGSTWWRFGIAPAIVPTTWTSSGCSRPATSSSWSGRRIWWSGCAPWRAARVVSPTLLYKRTSFPRKRESKPGEWMSRLDSRLRGNDVLVLRS